MRRKLILILAALVIVPTSVLCWLGFKVAQGEQQVLESRVVELLAARLADTRASVARFIEERQRASEELCTPPSLEPDMLRTRMRRAPWVEQIFVLDVDGELRFPSLEGSLSRAERAFLRRTEQLWTRQDALHRPSEGDTLVTSGWYSWYWENGLSLIFWRRDRDGRVIGVELGRARLLADVMAVLPAGGDETDSRTVLVDARDQPVYQWGGYEPAANERPRVELPLSPPLGSWKLRHFLHPASFAAARGGSLAVGVGGGLLATFVALSLLATYFYRESTRELREASQRVSFVNQVSHELKTPLTNIRMYAELLESRIDDSDPRAARHLSIIVSESQRLSRLIANVLTFAKQARGLLKLRRAPGCIDEVVSAVLTQFAPSLATKSIDVEQHLDAPATAQLDADVVAQIVANLISNVEKYAASGRYLGVVTSRRRDTSTIVVEDRGPGIPQVQAEQVFLPFVRLHRGLTEAVAGTGIGLGLSRDLARLHGGDLCLIPGAQGTRLVITLHTPEEHERPLPPEVHKTPSHPDKARHESTGS